MTVTIPHFISFEVRDLVETAASLRMIAAGRVRAVITVIGVESVIHMAVEPFGAVKPWAHADEDAARKPVRAVIAVGSAIVRRRVVIAVGADRGYADFDSDLSLHFGSGQTATDPDE